jgi:uncharacterized protein (TIGR02246 family)
MAFEGPIEDRLAIRERIDSYCDAVFRKDPEDWIACWAEEGVWRLPGSEVAGRDNIKAAWINAMSRYELAGFYASPGHIEVDGGSAVVRAYTQENLQTVDGGFIKIIGSYADTLVKRDGAWLFTSRTYTVLRMDT